MEAVTVVVAHNERATLRVGDVFLKVDSDQARIDVELEAMPGGRCAAWHPPSGRPRWFGQVPE